MGRARSRQSFVARSAGEPDPLVSEAVRNLMPWHRSGTAALPVLLSISERQLRRRCRAAVGVGPKELHRILRLQGFVARVQASIDRQGASDVDLARGPSRPDTTTRHTSAASTVGSWA